MNFSLFRLIIPLAMWLDSHISKPNHHIRWRDRGSATNFHAWSIMGQLLPWKDASETKSLTRLIRRNSLKRSYQQRIWYEFIFWKRCFDTSNTNNEKFDSASDWLRGNHDSIKGFMTHSGEGVDITNFPGEREGWGEGEKQTKSKTLLHTKFVFRCVLASLYEGLSVRPWVRPSVGPSVSIKEVRARTHLMAVYPALFKDENRWRWPVTLQLAYRSNKKLIQRKPVWKALIVLFFFNLESIL